MHRVTRDDDGLVWQTPWRSKNEPDCVDVALLPDGGAVVRNSRQPEGPRVEYSASEWSAFVASVKDGQFG